jgi:hypothetical protein
MDLIRGVSKWLYKKAVGCNTLVYVVQYDESNIESFGWHAPSLIIYYYIFLNCDSFISCFQV